MRLEGMEIRGGGGGGAKPVPLPRRTNQNLLGREISKDSNVEDVNCNGPTPPPRISTPTPGPNKPTPFPRKAIQRNTDTSTPHTQAEEEDDLDYSTIPSLPLAPKDPKRGTINLFKLANQLQDPFDTDFESSIQGVQVLSTISFTSPLCDLKRKEEMWTGDDCDHYMEPPPPRPLSSGRRGEGLSGALKPTTTHLHQLKAKTPLGKVLSCPSASVQEVEEEDGIYEPISSYSSSDSISGIKLRTPYSSPLTSSRAEFPQNDNFSNAKRVTVPNVDNLFKPTLPSSAKSETKCQKGLSPTTLDLSHLFSNKASSRLALDPTMKRRSIASSTETTDSFGSFERSSRAEVGRSWSHRSSGGSERGGYKKAHEYDDVAIEDGNVILLDNQNSEQSQPASSDSTNNNSNSSLTSRNSVIAEFDPLLTIEPSWVREEGEKVGSGSKSSPPLNLNDEEQHRYEFIDTDPDEGLSDSTVDNLEGDGRVGLCAEGCVDNPNYFSEEKKWARWEDELKEDEYEAVSEVSPKASKSPSPSPHLSPPPPDHQTPPSLVNQSSFFRRFSSKFRLNSIKEEQRDCEKKDPGSLCNKCSMEHTENGPCKFIPTCRANVLYSSNLYKSGGMGRKDFVRKRVVLAKGKLAFYNDKSDVISQVPLEKVTVMFKRDDHRVNGNLPNLKYFELGLVNWKSSSIILAGSTETERGMWMEKYIEAQTGNIPQSVIGNFDRGGWCFMKETVTSSWRPSWLILKDRSLYYAYQNSSEYYEMDLRKARSIGVSVKEEEQRCPFVDSQEVLTIDLICKILYVQTESGKVTLGWEKGIQTAASFNGLTFEEMQLTLDNVPVIVDKCIDFLYAHGTLAEGIYRQSGLNTRIAQLLADFQKDAWGVQISHKEFSAHDVAGTLKRFFRTLPEPLVTCSIYEDWIKASSIMKRESKLAEYIRLLESLPKINYNIMKKLICHLYAVHELHEKNLMPLINLAPIWGPTLMNVDTSKVAQSYETACAECEVVKDLIENYYKLFRVDPQEIAREKKMQDALENFHLGSCRRKHSGDMKIWIYLWDKDDTSAINVTLTPQTTAHGIVDEMCRKCEIGNVDDMSVHEVICEKGLERPLHPSEKVIESVLRWSIWEIEERRHNFLILKKNQLYPPLLHYAKEPTPLLSGELKYADTKSKTFRKSTFTLARGTLKCFKDAKGTAELASWNLQDMVWYIGCESKRAPPTKWTLTVVKRNYPFKRSKEEPFFGSVISCPSQEELEKWLGALLVGEHPEGLYPSVFV